MENDKMHLRHVMLWEFRQGRSAKATAEKICSVYGEGRITDRAVRNWFIKFRSGDTSLKDEPRAGRPTEFDEKLLKEILEEDPHQSTRKIAERLNTSQATVCRHLEKLGRINDRFDEKLLKELLEEDPNLSPRKIAEKLNTPQAIVSRHLAKLAKVNEVS